MNILKKSLGINTSNVIGPPVNLFSGFSTTQPTSSGVAVTPKTTLQHPAVYTCIRTLTSDISKIPLKIEKFIDGGWKTDTSFYINNVLRSPNDRMVTFEIIESIIQGTLLSGNGYIIVIRNADGKPIELIPCNSFNTFVVEDSKDGELYYKVSSNLLIAKKTSISTETGSSRTIYQSDMIRIRNLSLDNGVNGLSLIQLASEAFGLSLATQEAAARAFSNGAHISGYFKGNGRAGREQTSADKERLDQKIKSVGNAGATAIIDGYDWVPVNSNVADLQLIEARREATAEIARMYRIPMYKLGLSDSEKAANIAEQEQSYITNTLMQYTTPLEQHMDRVLLNDQERQFYRIRFDFSKQAEPNEQVRGDYYKNALTYGWMTQNEVREREDLAPVKQEGTDTLRSPLNTGVAGAEKPDNILGETDENKKNKPV